MNNRYCVHVALLAALMCTDVFGEDGDASAQKRLEDGLRVDLWYGGWEPDYTKSAYEMMLSYRGFETLHLYAGFGDGKQIYYDRSKVYAGGYYFYQDRSYFKAFVSRRSYDYPLDPATLTVNPDSSSYRRDPKLELEISHLFREALRGELSYEASRPNFFHDPAVKVTNHKLGARLRVDTAITGLRADLYAAMLHDPDPNKTEVKGRDNPRTALGTAAATDVVYKNSYLYGAAIGYGRDAWQLEVKWLQNRDLDNSYDYSLLNKITYRIGDDRYLQVDYVHDVFSNQSNFAGQTANVYAISYYRQYSPRLKFGLGAKHIGVPSRAGDTGFLFLEVNTGLMLE